MNSDKLQGKAKNGAGRLEAAAGAAMEDPEMQIGGEVHQFQGRVQEAVGAAKETLARSAGQARAFVTDVVGHAGDSYGDLRDTAQDVIETVDPFVKQRPYAALALAGIVGLVLGALFFGGGAKVIYIKPART